MNDNHYDKGEQNETKVLTEEEKRSFDGLTIEDEGNSRYEKQSAQDIYSGRLNRESYEQFFKNGQFKATYIGMPGCGKVFLFLAIVFFLVGSFFIWLIYSIIKLLLSPFM